MKKSLQEIEDFYKNKGYSGSNLRKILEKDEEWKSLVKERNKKLDKNFSLTKSEKRKYVMSTNEDYEILDKIKQLEKLGLKKEDRHFIKVLRSQLEYDWRKPLLIELKIILKKYSKHK